MLIEFLFTSLFIFSNFSLNTNDNIAFENRAKINFAAFKRNQDKAEYNESFVDLLYDNNCINSQTTITVLTPGMGGNRDYWFPKITSDISKSDFGSTESIAYQILSFSSYDEDNIPILSFSTKTSNLSVSDVKIQQLVYRENEDQEYNFEDCSIDYDFQFQNLFSNHVILIYDGIENFNETGYENNDEMARYFCKGLDSVLAKISVFYKGNLPKINLIGHSRGGLLNLRYAAKRTKLVDNLISIATPYTGSKWAEALSSLCNLGRLANINNDLFSYVVDGVLNDGAHNSSYYLSQTGNTNNVAIGCETSPSLFAGQILNEIGIIETMDLSEITFGNNNLVWRVFNSVYQYLINNSNITLYTIVNLATNLKSLANTIKGTINIVDFIDNLLDLFPNYDSFLDGNSLGTLKDYALNFLNDLIEVCDDVINYDTDTGCLRTDFCVDLDSQIGSNLGINLFDERTIIPFGLPGYGSFQNKYLSNSQLPKVTHNYECNMQAVINKVLYVLRTRSSINSLPVSGQFDFFSISPYKIPAYCLSLTDQEIYYPTSINFFGDELGFSDYYYYESEISQNNSLLYKSALIDDVLVSTKRMRTGFIHNERIVLSPNRSNAGLAFLEFEFLSPVHIMSFKLSLWGINENNNNSQLTFVHTYDEDLRDFVLGQSALFTNNFNVSDYPTMTSRGQLTLLSGNTLFNSIDWVNHNISALSTDRDNPNEYLIESDSGFTYIGFYAACYPTSTQNNRGRICLSDFTIIF